MGKRKHDVWTPDNWDDGYFDNRGRYCAGCGESVVRKRGRIRYSNVFCSNACYQATPRTSEHKRAISSGLRRAYADGTRAA